MHNVVEKKHKTNIRFVIYDERRSSECGFNFYMYKIKTTILSKMTDKTPNKIKWVTLIFFLLVVAVSIIVFWGRPWLNRYSIYTFVLTMSTRWTSILSRVQSGPAIVVVLSLWIDGVL